LPSDLAASPPTATAVMVNTGATLIIADTIQADIGSLAGGGSVQIGTADATTTLFIGAGSPATTTFSGAITGPGSLELDGGSLTLTGAGNNIGGDFTVCACDVNGVTIKGGSLVVGGLTSVEGGTLAVSNGGTLTTGDLGVGSNMTISGVGSVVTATGNTGIGVGGPGTLMISGGGVLNSQGATEIDSFAGTPAVTVTGAASTWNVSAKMTVGNGAFSGPGSLIIANGGAVNATGSFMEIGDQATGTSQVTVTGAGSVLTVTNRMAVGDASGEPGAGAGSLTIANGGVVNARGPFLDIGDAVTGTSLVTVTGTGSTLNVATSLAVGTQCGCEVGTLTIADGAVVNSSVITRVGAGSTLNLGTGGLAGSMWPAPGLVDSMLG
jgi:T5SS/PEP-CTERM-associated repeat protein